MQTISVMFPSSNMDDEEKQMFVSLLTKKLVDKKAGTDELRRVVYWCSECDDRFLPSLGRLVKMSQTETQAERAMGIIADHQQRLLITKKQDDKKLSAGHIKSIKKMLEGV